MARGIIVKRGKSWSAVINVQHDPKTGKRQQIWKSASTKREAEKLLTDTLAEIDQGRKTRPTKESFGSFMQNWLENKCTEVRGKTAEGYQQRGKHLIDGLGHNRLIDLQPDDIRRYYRERSQSLSGATLTKHHQLLKQALDQAVTEDKLKRNVAAAVKPPRATRKEMRALTGPEVHRMLEACEDTPWHAIFHTLTWCGLRRSELLGLRRKDVDLLMATLRVVQTYQTLNDGTPLYQEPKTAAGRRTIALSPASCLELRSHREKQEKDTSLLGIPLTQDTLVFSHPDGSPRVPSTLTLAFRRLTRRIGFTGVRLHDLRHTMASLYLQQGVSPKTVAERLGHASVTITLDLYSHCLPGVQEAAAAQFDAAMESAKSFPNAMAPANLR